MSRAVTTLILGLALTACGSREEAASEPTRAAGKRQAPTIVMVSAAGRQIAPPGSSCLEYLEKDGSGTSVCATMGMHPPKRYSVARRGERLEFRVDAAMLVRNSAGCSGSGCGSTANVIRLECPALAFPADTKPEATFELDGDHGGDWRVDLKPGVYQIDVLVRFEAADVKGDHAGTFGVIVDDERTLQILEDPCP